MSERKSEEVVLRRLQIKHNEDDEGLGRFTECLSDEKDSDYLY